MLSNYGTSCSGPTLFAVSALLIIACARTGSARGGADRADSIPTSPPTEDVVECFASDRHANCAAAYLDVSLGGIYESPTPNPKESVVLTSRLSSGIGVRLNCVGQIPSNMQLGRRYRIRGAVKRVTDDRAATNEPCEPSRDLIGDAACEERRKWPVQVFFAEGCLVERL